MTSTVASTSTLSVLAMAIVATLTIFATNMLGVIHEVEQLTTMSINFSICEPSPSLVKRSRDSGPSTPIE